MRDEGRLRLSRTALSILLASAVTWLLICAPLPSRAAGVTFLCTSDSHYDAYENEDRNQRNQETIEQMNRIAKVRWPKNLGGERIDKPRGVVLLGDVLDDGDKMFRGLNQGARQFRYFAADFGLDGTDGVLKYPVFEGWGNHDGPPAGRQKHAFSFQAELKYRNAMRKEKGLVANLSNNGLHYSWDWDRVHLVQLNLYPGSAPHPKTRYSPVHHDPQRALDFLKADLAAHVGRSGRPVVLMHHYDLQGTDWWHNEERSTYYDAIKDYNVVLVLHGHTGTEVYRWRGLDVVNDGQTEKGFFVVQITDDRLRLAYRVKEGVKTTKNPDKSITREWGGRWGWKWLLDKKLDPRPRIKDRSPTTGPNGRAGIHRCARKAQGLSDDGLAGIQRSSEEA